MADETQATAPAAVTPVIPGSLPELNSRFAVVKQQLLTDLRGIVLDAANAFFANGAQAAEDVVVSDAKANASVFVSLGTGAKAEVAPFVGAISVNGQPASLANLLHIAHILLSTPAAASVEAVVKEKVGEAVATAERVVTDAGEAAVGAVRTDLPGVIPDKPAAPSQAETPASPDGNPRKGPMTQ